MKKLILPVIFAISFLFFLPQNLNAQTNLDCRKIFDKEMYKCLTDSNACSDACMKETEKPDGSAYFNSGEIYQKCMKASDCEGESSACNKQALANFRACGKSDQQPQEAKKETPKQDKNPLIQTVSDLFVDYIIEFDGQSSEDSRPAYAFTLGGKYSFSGELDAYAEMEFVYLVDGDKPAEPLFIAPFEDATYTNSTQDPVRLGYNFADSDKEAELVLYPSATITYYLNRATSLEVSITPAIELDYGEIEVKIDDTEPNRKLVFWTDFLSASAKFTHFWVFHDPTKRQSTVGVYEGEVEIKTKDGKTITVAPDGDKPGVVVVTRKLSPVKLALAGLVLAAVIGGTFLVVRRKFSLKGFSKKKK